MKPTPTIEDYIDERVAVALLPVMRAVAEVMGGMLKREANGVTVKFPPEPEPKRRGGRQKGTHSTCSVCGVKGHHKLSPKCKGARR